MIEIDDFVMLGTTVPEPNSDGRVFVCSAGLSPQLGTLLRVYPLARRHVPRRWHVHTVRLERPSRQADSRRESWKIAGDRAGEAHERINDEFIPAGVLAHDQRREALRPFFADSIAELNDRRASLGIIAAGSAQLEFESNPESPDSPQLRLFDVPDQPTSGAKRFAVIPRVRFDDRDGSHALMLRDWGAYELMRKSGYDYAQANMASALHLSASSMLLVGNLNHQRNAWLVISVLNGLNDVQLSLLDGAA